MSQSINEFLAEPELRTHVINDLKITPITVYEISVLDRVQVLAEHARIHTEIREYDLEKERARQEGREPELEDPTEKLVLFMGKTILRAIFGYDKEFSEEDCRKLAAKYSDDITTEIFNRILTFRDLEQTTIDAAKKP